MKRRPFLSQALSNPTARERLLRYAQFYLALSHCKNLQIWAMEVRAKYREMIFGILKLKFDEDKAYSLSSQILTKSAKSARETSRIGSNLSKNKKP